MEDPQLVMTVTFNPRTGEVGFLIPNAHMLVLGMLRMLEAHIQANIIDPMVKRKVLMPHERPGV